MGKAYEVLHDTWLRGHPYASGSNAVLSEEDAEGYIRAGLVKGEDDPDAKKPAKPKAGKE